MVETALVVPDIEAGRRFLDVLHTGNFPLVAALWQVNSYGNRWEFDIVTPLVEELGAREAYRRLEELFANTSDRRAVQHLNVSVFGARSPFYKGLRRDLRRVKDYHVMGGRPGDQDIRNGFIYFVK